MAESKQDCERLLNAVLPVAETMLRRHGEFYPFGCYMEPDGRIVHPGAEDGDTDHPKSKDLIFILRDALRELVRANNASPPHWHSMYQLPCLSRMTRAMQSRFVSIILRSIRLRFSFHTTSWGKK